MLKNNGYNLAHNFGHGKKYLARTFAAMNLLAFAFHTPATAWNPSGNKHERLSASGRASFKTCTLSRPMSSSPHGIASSMQ